MFARLRAVPTALCGLLCATAGATLAGGLQITTAVAGAIFIVVLAAAEVIAGSAPAGPRLLARSAVRDAAVGDCELPAGLARARAVVQAHGEDSLSPFILRPDKSFAFAAGAVIAYRVIGRSAIVSGDPVGPADAVPEVLGRLLVQTHEMGGRVVIYGSSARHLATYRALGLRDICVGEEAVVDPATFSLEGRAVRKLRQSVNRVQRRGWRIEAYRGRDVDESLEAEIDAVESEWRSQHERMLGFAMAMGEFDLGVRPADLYLLARSPDGRLSAVMRFLAHCGDLSLDTMRRVGETPNGLNEALVCRALEVARERGVGEVSLNYAGLGHLVRQGPTGNWLARRAQRIGLAWLGRRFQMDRLVRFNEKFSPQWRPRYLVYESRRHLPGAVLRVLQSEGYLPAGKATGTASPPARPRQLASIQGRSRR